MSSPRHIPQTQAMNNQALTHSGSPGAHGFLIPSPIVTRRTRTYSASERAKKEPRLNGIVKTFCRNRGHGFIIPLDPNEDVVPLFCHVSDIEGEYVPKEGDEVTYQKCLIPPRNEKYQAIHVKITHLAPGVTHEKWDSPSPPVSPKMSTPPQSV